MKCTVLIIAHNESAHIEECLRSVFSQSVKADEVLLIAHNCTDDTAFIARKFPLVRVEELHTDEVGPIFARIRGFELASHEIIACIDGDAVADREWLYRITEPLESPAVAGAGGSVRFIDDLWGNISALLFFRLWTVLPNHHFYFWGANFACKKSVYAKEGWLSPLVALWKGLGLAYLADDCYLSLSLERRGKVLFIPDALVLVHSKQEVLSRKIQRSTRQSEDCRKLFVYFWIR